MSYKYILYYGNNIELTDHSFSIGKDRIKDVLIKIRFIFSVNFSSMCISPICCQHKFSIQYLIKINQYLYVILILFPVLFDFFNRILHHLRHRKNHSLDYLADLLIDLSLYRVVLKIIPNSATYYEVEDKKICIHRASYSTEDVNGNIHTYFWILFSIAQYINLCQ